MEYSTETIQQQTLPVDVPNDTLKVDFTWRKFKTLITRKDDPESKPVYIVDFSTCKNRLDFISGADDAVFATGQLHVVTINCEAEIRGQPRKIKAEKRWTVGYSYPSPAFGGQTMTWTSASGFKQWDFILVDERKEPVAKLGANIWAMKKLGNIEFMGVISEEQREDIVVTGLTVYYFMLYRSMNIFNFFGAIFHRTGGDEKDKAIDAPGQLEHGKDNRLDVQQPAAVGTTPLIA